MKVNDADMIYFGNQEAQKVYLGSQLVWELQQSESIIINGASVGIHPNYVWIESSEIADVKGALEGNIQKVVLNDKVTINHPFEYDRWNNSIIQLEGHPDNPTIYEEIRNALGPKDSFSGVKVSIYPIEQPEKQPDEQTEDTSITLTGVHNSQSASGKALVFPTVSRLSELGVDIHQVKQIEINGEMFEVDDVLALSSNTFVFLDRPFGFEVTGNEAVTLYIA